MSNKVVNLVCDTKASIKAKVCDELQIFLSGQDNGSGYWSHAWNADGTRVDEQTATAGGAVTFTIS